MTNPITPALISLAISAVDGISSADNEADKKKWREANGGELPSEKMEKKLDELYRFAPPVEWVVTDLGGGGKAYYIKNDAGKRDPIDFIAIDDPYAQGEFTRDGFTLISGGKSHSVQLPSQAKYKEPIGGPVFSSSHTHLYLPDHGAKIKIDFTNLIPNNDRLLKHIYPHGELNMVVNQRNINDGKSGKTEINVNATDNGKVNFIGSARTLNFGPVLYVDGIVQFRGNNVQESAPITIFTEYNKDPFTLKPVENKEKKHIPVSVEAREGKFCERMEVIDSCGNIPGGHKNAREKIVEMVGRVAKKSKKALAEKSIVENER